MKKFVLIILFIIFLPGLIYLPLLIAELNSYIIQIVSDALGYPFYYHSAFSQSGKIFSEENMLWQKMLYFGLFFFEILFIIRFFIKKGMRKYQKNRQTENIPVSVGNNYFSEAKKCLIHRNIDEETNFYFSKSNLIMVIFGGIGFSIALIGVGIQRALLLSQDLLYGNTNSTSPLTTEEMIYFPLGILLILFIATIIYGSFKNLIDNSPQLTVNKKGIYSKKEDILYQWEDIVGETLVMGKYGPTRIEFYCKSKNNFILLDIYNLNFSQYSFRQIFETHRAKSTYPYYHYVRNGGIGVILPISDK